MTVNFKAMLIVISILIFWGLDANCATTVRLLSSSSGDLPFTFGIAFKKGDIPSGVTPTLDVNDYQVTIKKTWNDGSAKHAIFSGHTTFTANTEKTITVNFNGTPPTGTNLTSSDISTAAPSASNQFGSIGTVSLSSLLSSPARTWLSGPEMVECHYHAAVGSHATLSAWFYVRLYKSGAMHVRVIADNSQVDVGAAAV